MKCEKYGCAELATQRGQLRKERFGRDDTESIDLCDGHAVTHGKLKLLELQYAWTDKGFEPFYTTKIEP